LLSILDSEDLSFKSWILNNKPAKVYLNSAESKSLILKDNKGLSGIYLWLNNQNDKYYIGSAVNLKDRLYAYYNTQRLINDNYRIQRAIIKYTHSKFTLYILEYCNIKDLIEREQYYLDLLTPPYNILLTAGSRLGKGHSEEALEKMRISKEGDNNPMFSLNHNKITKATMNISKKGIPLTETHKAKLSLAKKGVSISDSHKTAISLAMKGKTITDAHKSNISLARTGILFSEETKLKMSKKVYVYSNESPSILIKEFNSYSEAIQYFSCSKSTISKYIDSNKLYLNK